MKLSIVSRVTLITIILVILAGSTVSYVFYKNTAELLVERTLKDLAESIQVQGNVIRNHVLTQQKDGIFTANTPPIMGIYRAIHNNGFDKEGGSTKEQWLERLQQIFTSILISDPDYYQIRYIGEDRKEIVNVIKTDDGVKIIPQTLLQNKAHREYVKEGFKLEKGKTFLSEINLNKEHGKIVYPRKEILRTVVPIHTNDKKSPIGLIVLNTEIGHELKRMQQKMHASGREIYITNDGGGYLVHPDPELTYGFDLGKRYRVQEDFPLVSKLFVPGNTDKTIILLPEKTKTDELVVYTKVLLSPATGNHFIAVGLSQSYDDVIRESLSTLKDTVMWAVLLALLTSLLAGFILTNSLRPLKRLATAMTNLSTGKDVDFHLPTFQQDEVGLLSRNFVQMAGEINKAKNELEKSNQQLEDRVEIRTRELKESETKQRIILENMIDGLITTDKNYHILSLNIAAEKMFMYKAEEIIGQSFDILLNTDALRPPATQSEQNLIFSLHSLVGNFQRIVGRRKDGKTFNLDVAVSQALIDGRPILTVLTRDVTQLTKAENEILRAKNEAETANLAKSEFLSSMSHELRTPMNAIIGFSQLLQMGDDESPLTEQQKSNVDEIYVAGQHLLDLINEILDLSRIEAGHIALSLESVALDSVLVECLNLINPLATKRNIKISVLIQGKSINVSDVQNDRHFLFADRIRLKQVILNLLSNAVKYNRDNGSITINCERQKEKQLRISITDTGLGLNEEKQNELFQAFNRLGAERTEIEGTGVGLVISKRIIELMSGSIGANSTQNVGSTFWIQLPLDKTESSENNITLHSTHKDLSNDNPAVTGQYTALYIEDNPANIRLVEQVLLSRPQITLITSKSPIPGIEAAIKQQPDLILLDINLPGLDGYQILDILRNKPNFKDTPILAISANAMERDIKKGLAAGFNQYITKPIDVIELLSAIDKSLLSLRK